MKRIEDDIAELKHQLNQLLLKLSNLNEDKFEEQIGAFEKDFSAVLQRSEEINKEYPREEIKKYHPELKKITKEIQRKFDNVIEEKKNEIQSISSNLRTLSNRKKLANYFG